MARIASLPPRIQMAPTSRGMPAPRIGATPRERSARSVKRRLQWLMDNPLCAHCRQAGDVTNGQEVDHIVPLWQGGADDETNFQTLCIPHHKAKTAAEAKERNQW